MRKRGLMVIAHPPAQLAAVKMRERGLMIGKTKIPAVKVRLNGHFNRMFPEGDARLR